jgi:plastocyanin
MSSRSALLLVSLSLTAASGVSCGKDLPTGASAVPQVHIIAIRGDNGAFSFDPVNEVVQVGQAVAWKNQDSVTHSLVDKDGLLSTGRIAPGATSGVVALSAPATVQYYCSDNPAMKGLLSVNP